jgi:hypothetical protein
MGLVARFAPSAYLSDFNGIAGQLDQRHRTISSWFDDSISMEASGLAHGDHVQFYNPSIFDPGGNVIEQAIVWNAFTTELLRQCGREEALIEADRLWPLTRYSAKGQGPEYERVLYT